MEKSNRKRKRANNEATDDKLSQYSWFQAKPNPVSFSGLDPNICNEIEEKGGKKSSCFDIALRKYFGIPLVSEETMDTVQGLRDRLITRTKKVLTISLSAQEREGLRQFGGNIEKPATCKDFFQNAIAATLELDDNALYSELSSFRNQRVKNEHSFALSECGIGVMNDVHKRLHDRAEKMREREVEENGEYVDSRKWQLSLSKLANYCMHRQLSVLMNVKREFFDGEKFGSPFIDETGKMWETYAKGREGRVHRNDSGGVEHFINGINRDAVSFPFDALPRSIQIKLQQGSNESVRMQMCFGRLVDVSDGKSPRELLEGLTPRQMELLDEQYRVALKPLEGEALKFIKSHYSYKKSGLGTVKKEAEKNILIHSPEHEERRFRFKPQNLPGSIVDKMRGAQDGSSFHVSLELNSGNCLVDMEPAITRESAPQVGRSGQDRGGSSPMIR